MGHVQLFSEILGREQSLFSAKDYNKRESSMHPENIHWQHNHELSLFINFSGAGLDDTWIIKKKTFVF